MTVRRKCACRGVIEAEPHHEAVQVALVEHQRSSQHQEWRELGGMTREVVDPGFVQMWVHGQKVLRRVA